MGDVHPRSAIGKSNLQTIKEPKPMKGKTKPQQCWGFLVSVAGVMHQD
jgi:hypothetical protein